MYRWISMLGENPRRTFNPMVAGSTPARPTKIQAPFPGA